jgi:hypothetical protein
MTTLGIVVRVAGRGRYGLLRSAGPRPAEGNTKHLLNSDNREIMSRPRTRRALLSLCGTGLCLGAGCLDGRLSESDSDDAANESTRTNDTTPERQTVSPADVSNAAARDRALAAEEEFLRAELENASCLNGWGTTPSTASESAEVVERSADGVTVSVTHPYWFSTDDVEADGASNAFHVVTKDGTQRASGTEIDPC